MKKISTNYNLLFVAFKGLGIPEPQMEYKFHPKRKWRFDFCWPDHKLALEIEGGVWTNGGHTRGSGFIKDMEKYNEAAILGFTLLRATVEDAENGQAAILIQRFLEARKKLFFIPG